MNALVLGARNLARNRRRTALSAAIVGAGTCALVLTAGFVRFSFDGLREAMIRGGLGHLEVAEAAAVEGRGAMNLERPAGEALAGWRALEAEIAALPHVDAVGATLHLMGIVRRDDGPALAFAGVGADPAAERRLGFPTKLRSGEPLPDEAPAGVEPVLLAEGLARSLGVGPGDRVTLLTTRDDGMLNALDATVSGTYTTGVAELDTRFLKLSLATAQRLAETTSVSNLLVTLDRTERTDGVAADLRARLAGHEPPLAVTPWSDRAPFYAQVRGLYRGIFDFLGAIVGLLVVLAASNTLVMIVFERTRELGTLRAIGTTPGQVAALILAEAGWLGLLGSAVGVAAGWVGVRAINALELRMPPPPGAVDPIDLRLVFVPEAAAGATALMLIVLLVAAIVPIVRAVRMPVVEALEHA